MPPKKVSHKDKLARKEDLKYDEDGYLKLKPPVYSLAVKLTSNISSSSSPDDPCLPDPQTSSPLFNKLPQELREKIFRLALLEHDQLSRPIPFHSLQYRPSHQFARSFSGLSLLRTCKLIYLSSYLVPILTATHRDYIYSTHEDNERTPLRHAKSSDKVFASMTVQQREAVQTIHVYTPQGILRAINWADGRIYLIDTSRDDSGYSRLRPFVEGEVRPTKLVITVRHYDWDGWPGGKTLSMSDHSLFWKRESFRIFGDRLKEIVMELETTEERKDELESVVEHVRQWKIGVGNDMEFVTDGIDVERKVWEGAKFGADYRVSVDKSARQKYYMAVVRWKEGSESSVSML